MRFIIVHSILRRRLAMAHDLFVTRLATPPTPSTNQTSTTCSIFCVLKNKFHMQTKLETALLVLKKVTGFWNRSLHMHKQLAAVQLCPCSARVGTRKDQIWRLVPSFFMPQKRFLRCFKDHGPASAHTSTNVLTIHVGKSICCLKKQVFWDVMACWLLMFQWWRHWNPSKSQ